MKFKWRNILILLGLFLAVVLLIDFNRRMEELDSLTAKLNSVRAEGTSIMQTQAALKPRWLLPPQTRPLSNGPAVIKW